MYLHRKHLYFLWSAGDKIGTTPLGEPPWEVCIIKIEGDELHSLNMDLEDRVRIVVGLRVLFGL